MLILPITTPTLKTGDDLPKILHASGMIEPGDIIVVSSKAIATVEDAAIDLARIKPSTEAERLARICSQDPRFTQAVLDETKRLNGAVVGTCPWALITSLRPTGMNRGRILCPNAGLDRSNVRDGFAIGWPEDPVESVDRLWERLKKLLRERSANSDQRSARNRAKNQQRKTNSLAMILSDSCCMPGRLGVIAFTLVCAGIDPVLSKIGEKDLFRNPLKFTNEAIADQLATAANAVMGNAAESTPAAIIRDHGLPFSDFCGWVEGIEPENDLFAAILES